MSVLLSIATGWTGRLGPFTLRVDGTPLNLTGFTVTLTLVKWNGIAVTPGGVITVNADQVNNPGQVVYDPISTDFVCDSTPGVRLQNYDIRWKVTDGLGKVVYFPNAASDQISVYRP